MIEPLTPSDCDLSGYKFMPVDIVRLFGSRFHAIANDAEWRAGVTLWLKSFHQVPAASLPDDDIELCRLAELGRDLKAWKKVKEKALHGWIKCDDGRLYHPVVAEKAIEAWEGRRQKSTERKADADRLRAWRERRRNASETRFSETAETPDETVDETPPETLMKSVRKGKGEGNGNGEGNSVAIATAPMAPLDAREAIWSEGLAILKALTGKREDACRRFLGKLLASAADDCPKVLLALRRAVEMRPLDPASWLVAELDTKRKGTIDTIREEGSLPTFLGSTPPLERLQ